MALELTGRIDEKGVPVIGFPNYEIYQNGDVISLQSNRIMKTQISNSGYVLIHLSNNGFRKACTVHRLVATHFISNPENKIQVNHKDGNKLNNNVENLEWVTGKENMHHSIVTGLFDNARAKARIRMSEIGKKYAKQNTKNLLESNIKLRKPVLQYSLDGSFIKEHESTKSAIQSTKCNNILKALKGVYKQSGGFIWKYKSAC